MELLCVLPANSRPCIIRAVYALHGQDALRLCASLRPTSPHCLPCCGPTRLLLLLARSAVRVADDAGQWTVSRRFRHFEVLHRQLRIYSTYRLRLPPKRIFVHSQVGGQLAGCCAGRACGPRQLQWPPTPVLGWQPACLPLS